MTKVFRKKNYSRLQMKRSAIRTEFRHHRLNVTNATVLSSVHFRTWEQTVKQQNEDILLVTHCMQEHTITREAHVMISVNILF